MPAKVLAAFQGELGAFSQEAAYKMLGAGTGVLPCTRFEDVFKALKEKQATAAVIPLENTLHGSVHENYDHLLRFDFTITAETSIRIVHNLIAPPGLPFSKVRRVYSHPVALNQCLKFFADHPDIERIVHYDTAGSVKMVMADRPPEAAAIASAAAARIYGGRILKRSIEDDRQNYTRFVLLRRPEDAVAPRKTEKKAVWKTSLVLSTKNVPGSLFRCLSTVALRDLNLIKIESRPQRGKPWEYMFYLDFEGRADDQNVKNALNHLGEMSDYLRVLGCYPKDAI